VLLYNSSWPVLKPDTWQISRMKHLEYSLPIDSLKRRTGMTKTYRKADRTIAKVYKPWKKTEGILSALLCLILCKSITLVPLAVFVPWKIHIYQWSRLHHDLVDHPLVHSLIQIPYHCKHHSLVLDNFVSFILLPSVIKQNPHVSTNSLTRLSYKTWFILPLG